MEYHIIILIDTSYSMALCMPKVINALNSFVSNLKNSRYNNGYFTLISFSNYVKNIVNRQNIISIPIFTEKDLYAYGSTALYDAVCTAVYENLDIPLKTSMFIISDGDDTMSVNSNKNDAQNLCDRAKSRGWDIIHCNTDENVLNVSQIKFNPETNLEDIFKHMTI